MSNAPERTAGGSVGEVRRALARGFRDAGLDSPELDARLLVGHVLGADHAALAAAANRTLSGAETAAIIAVANRRLAHEPVARIIGDKEFWGLGFTVTPATLVPRPETETVVEAALAAIEQTGPRGRPLRIADLGTGTGAILLALLSELPGAVGVGTDISVAALTVARANAERLGFAARASFVACDLVAALHGPFDLVVSNPPYVATGDIPTLAPDVRAYDPHTALDGGPDGLTVYRAIAAEVPRILTPGGALVVELGAGQDQPVAALFAQAGLATMPPRNDLAGIARALSARLLP